MADILFAKRDANLDELEKKAAGKFRIINIENTEHSKLVSQDTIQKVFFDKIFQTRKKTFNGKTLDEELKLEGQTDSFWCFLEAYLFNRTGLTFLPGVLSFHEIITIIERTKAVISVEKPKAAMFPEETDSQMRLIMEVCRRRGIRILSYKYKSRTGFSEKVSVLKYRPLVLRILTKINSMTTILISGARKIIGFKDTRKYDVLIVLGDKYNFNGRNIFFDSILTKFKEKNINYSIVKYSSVDEMKPLNILKEVSRRKVKLIKDYADLHSYRISLTNAKVLKERWQRIIHEKPFREYMKYEDIDIYPFLLPALMAINDIIIPFACETVAICDNLVRTERAKVILLETEVNSYSKGIIMSSKRLGAKTMAFQFGMILDYCDQTANSEPKPDIKAVGGNYQKDMLIKNNDYTKDKIKVIGEPRYDYLLNLKVDEAKIRKKYHIDAKSKILLFATQNLVEWTEDILALFTELLAADKGIHIIIKPHPAERDTKRFQDFANKNQRVSCIEVSEDTSYFVKSCDLLLTFWSTVAFEAILCEKPVVLVNFNRTYPEFLPFTSEGSALSVYEKDKFVDAIKNALHDKKTIAGLKEGRRRTIAGHGTQTKDGKVADRVYLLIKTFLRHNKL